jgi:hypothetical protein
MVKRGVWIAGCIIGVVVLGGLAVLSGYTILADLEGALNTLSIRQLVWPIILILGAGASAAGIFMTPREYQEFTQPEPETDEEPAQWIKDMRKQDKSNERS